MAYSIEIINTNDLKFRFQSAEVSGFNYTINSKVFRQALPDAPAKDTLILNLGKETNTDWAFSLRETEEDAAAGTHSSTVKTVQEKVDYLLNTFLTNGVEEKYTVNLIASAASISNITGILDRFSLNFTDAKPNSLPGSMSILVGGNKQV